MKNTLFSFLGLVAFSSSAFASPQLVATVTSQFERAYGYGHPIQFLNQRFEINRELGRAQVVVNYADSQDSMAETAPAPSAVHILVPGLRFEESSSSVVFERNGRQVNCADVSFKKGVTGVRTRIRATGKCRVIAKQETRSHDDGFQIKKTDVLEIWFDTQD